MGGYLADILDKAESDFIKSVLNVVNPKVKHIIILVVVIFYIISIMAWQQINNRMGLTTSLEGWTQIGTRASSGFLELRWFYLSPISPNLLFSTNFEMVTTLFLTNFSKLCATFSFSYKRFLVLFHLVFARYSLCFVWFMLCHFVLFCYKECSLCFILFLFWFCFDFVLILLPQGVHRLQAERTCRQPLSAHELWRGVQVMITIIMTTLITTTSEMHRCM